MRGSEKLPWARSLFTLLVHPQIWLIALRTGRRALVIGWWRRFPFLPRFDSRYVEFRLETQYGDVGVPKPHDLLAYLQWCKNIEGIRRGQLTP